MEMRPEIQIYAKQWTLKLNERKIIKIFDYFSELNKTPLNIEFL